MPRRVVAYCRVSSHEQLGNYSLPTQEERCRSWSQGRGWEIVSVEAEQHSGADLDGREGLQRALRLIESGAADTLLALTTDRLSREQMHIGLILDRVMRAGASLQFVDEDFENSPVGKFLLSARAFAAELELAKIGERTQRGRRARVASGKPIAGPKAPYGYQWADAAKSRLDIDPVTAPVVQSIFRMALGGLPLRQISERLADQGIPAPSGAPRWQPVSIREILLRPTYTGTMIVYATKHIRKAGGGYQRRPATADERVLLSGVAPPLVTPEEQSFVAAKLTENRRRSTRRNKQPEKSLLRAGHIVCGHCGWKMSVSNPSPGTRMSGPQYRCSARSQNGPACPRPTITASQIDDVVWAKVAEVLRDPSIIAKEVAKHRQDGGLERELEACERQLGSIANKQTAVARAISVIDDEAAAAPLITELKALAELKARGENRRTELERRIADQRAEDAKVKELSDWCAAVNANLSDLTYEDKRLALQWLGVQVQTYRLGTADEAGNPHPRWAMTMEIGGPGGNPVTVYGSTR